MHQLAITLHMPMRIIGTSTANENNENRILNNHGTNSMFFITNSIILDCLRQPASRKYITYCNGTSYPSCLTKKNVLMNPLGSYTRPYFQGLHLL
jgi:hypothetical protein